MRSGTIKERISQLKKNNQISKRQYRGKKRSKNIIETFTEMIVFSLITEKIQNVEVSI